MTTILLNPHSQAFVDVPSTIPDPRSFHEKLPGHSPTPLHVSPGLAEKIGVSNILIKHESDRFGLPAFKVLGASWAVYNLLKKRYWLKDEDWENVDQLKEKLDFRGFLSLITATDGNHGRGVARVAKWFGFSSRVFVPQETMEATIQAIESEGAKVEVVEGDYDKTVEEAGDHDGPVDWLIQDTGWEGYERIPKWIVEGYSTIFHEFEEQLKELEKETLERNPEMGGAGEEEAAGGDVVGPIRGTDTLVPDVVFVQIGVGSLAAAVVQYFKHRERQGKKTPLIIGVEPEGSACAYESVEAGKRKKVWDSPPTIMAGLNCGKVSYTAWPMIRDGIDAFVKVNDDRAKEAVRLLHDSGIETGESGAAGLPGLLEMRHQRKLRELLKARDVQLEEAVVLLIATEGITDPEQHASIVEE
jgi:diaminopropionate ammonia-lyase